MTTFSIHESILMLKVLQQKNWPDSIRILDYTERSGMPLGRICTVQIIYYGTSDWIECNIGKNVVYSLAHCYKFIRTKLNYDGAIRLAIAPK